MRIAEKLIKIADASRRDDGTDIPLGEQLREAATKLETLSKAAKELAESISFDDNGALMAGKWIGGNGGLISRDTITKADAVRRAISAFEQEKST